ncbi:MAG: zinc-dependent alcohol dehydrogenase family protein [Gammaproteobacteria bacterium]
MKAYQIVNNKGIDSLALNEIPDPKTGSAEVLVKVNASSINYRDLLTVEDPVARGLTFPRIPNSDGAGEVVAVGSDVTEFKVGDRVCSTFFQSWINGSMQASDHEHALGGSLEGMLAEYRAMPEQGLVHTPAHLTDVEAATLTCAAVTAWHSLVEVGRVTAGETVLLLGTGGVSIFALQFCQLLGARVIITSSDDAKLARARELGAWQTINYRQFPDWEEKVLEMTDGLGVDHTVEVGGAGTLEKSVLSTRNSGSIGLIGVLHTGKFDPMMILAKSIRLQGIYVGSREMFKNMNRAISANQLRPIVDKVYPFEQARQAYHDMRSAGHFGKLVIEIK